MNIGHDYISQLIQDINKLGKINFIVVTGGIGDFLTINYFLSFGYKTNIIFISKQSLKLKHLFSYYYPEKNMYSLYFNFSLIGKPGFDNTSELLQFFPIFKEMCVVNIADYFPLIRKSFLQIRNDKILNQIVKSDIKNIFNIPDKFAIIHPYTEDTRINCIDCNIIHKGVNKCMLTRNFLHDDYINVFDFLKEKNLTGVIISTIPINISSYSEYINIINLSYKQIDIIDCIELVKQCNYFFGVDSIFSLIASKNLPSNNMYIKCNNKHGYTNKDVYWFPIENINLQRFIKI